MTFQLIAGLMTHIGVTSPDQFDSKVVQLIEVVGAVSDLVGFVPWKHKSQTLDLGTGCIIEVTENKKL